MPGKAFFRTVGLLLPLALCGCNGKPVAPLLDQNERAYHDAENGFRFEAPDGWSRHSIAHFPPGRYEEERLLVKYKNLNDKRPTFFRVHFIDLPAGKTVTEHLTEKRPGPENWRMLGTTDKVKIDGADGTRYRFAGNWGPDDMIREIVAVPRGPRTLFFVGIHRVDDKDSRKAIEATFKTIRWDNRG